MICINDKKDCCGCAACVQVCHKHCIKLTEDAEGFLYPSVDKYLCTDCGLCDKICPMHRTIGPLTPFTTYAATNPDEYVRSQSSSGGIFSLFAEYVIGQGGVVFGAAFNDNWEVEHSYTESVEGLAKFRGSKYVQSQIGTSFSDVERFLKAGRQVLFSGTPCHVAGLKGYLRKDYENLLTVDCVCHGVPSPGIFREYLSMESNGKSISGINFGDKTTGWKNYSVIFGFKGKDTFTTSREHGEDRFMQGFLRNIYLRPSCYECHFRECRSDSDITLGDFWGIDKIRPELDDDKGLSLVIVNNKRTDDLLKALGCNLTEMSLSEAIKYNPSITTSVNIPPYRSLFFAARKNFGLKLALKLCCSSSIQYRIIRKIIKSLV